MATYTLKRDPSKYANLHGCDAKYWRMSHDFSKPLTYEGIEDAFHFTMSLLEDIVNAKAFKPENLSAATELLELTATELYQFGTDWNDEAPADINARKLAEATFVAYQCQRYALRIWYRDTHAAREATRPAPAKQEKPKAKAPAKQEKPKAKKAPAKQEVAKANEATFVSKLTKAQKKELLLTLMAELLK